MQAQMRCFALRWERRKRKQSKTKVNQKMILTHIWCSLQCNVWPCVGGGEKWCLWDGRIEVETDHAGIMYVAVCCSVLQCVAVCCRKGCLWDGRIEVVTDRTGIMYVAVCCSLLQCVAGKGASEMAELKLRQIMQVLCVLQYVAVYCSVLQCVAVCCRKACLYDGRIEVRTDYTCIMHECRNLYTYKCV